MTLVKFKFSVLLVYAFLPGIVLGVDLDSVRYVFHYGPLPSDNETYSLGDITEILTNSQFNESKNTVLYAHGYQENQDAESLRVIIEAYLERGDYNIITLNWTKLATGNYFLNSIPNLFQLSPVVASDLIKLFAEGLSLDKFYLVGHSLGGQLVGAIGRDVIAQSGNETILKRISALDPAFPGFYPGVFAKSISANDAKFVDIIHTDAGIYGAPVRTGTADFWPNGGRTLQPGCPPRNYVPLSDNDLCSHRRSWRFWAESVANKFQNKFNAVRTLSWFLFQWGITDAYDPEIVMGIDCPDSLKGNYYLRTNRKSPFAKGKNGAAYN